MQQNDVDLARVAALSDGVFAVAMTLLVAALPLPKNMAELGGKSLEEYLLGLLPHLRAIFIGFVVAAAFWRSHHDFFKALARADRLVIWLNFLLLFGVVLTPVGTYLLGSFPTQALTTDLYAVDLATIGAAFLLLWWHAGRRGFLAGAIDRRRLNRAIWGSAAVVAVFLASIPVSWFNPALAMWAWLLLIPVARYRRGSA